ncbi:MULTISPECIES: 2,3-bisphosphoglycerate-independent phosphoglycerate mutase [unclassified Imperialibacter]|uniref:2,3-bisphosphoglycerate-independent phosphoglycerate mutase n=1 Tax=unclassified Imperialibacter TaxID=2629706 RepID=UPI00125A2106|nr:MULTISPECIES: 2,3-bisphosphoglycerate-independent phosphoglycerate mutase [unclassified Imperialibacter]CAD5290044.1 2,3-bisphosphoglycerate-independent phosphoglycerate mutase [Imperialibacter sp. 89]CAD5290326.1 2,3-bisphosphoglycerate-independent phosphoglycerate mutase [Imperialibacter sp. 75]VVT34503.1 2,3-bisphosphoglycerate-independent phosphoglycerate mutase [Imperialibacter sp. EC-SDR9]
MNKKVILMILDGWGIASNPKVSAVDAANTPFVDSLYKKYPHSKLQASGLFVGLPDGQMGNSEVGHMNLGAGRVVYQDLVKLNKAVEENTLGDNEELIKALDYAKKNNKKVHFIGLVSDGGVHSHILHLKGLCSLAHEKGLEKVFVHAFTDGRDCDPKSGLGFLKDLQSHMKKTAGAIASITGRYFAMDRDKRWERVKLAYDAMVKGEGKKTGDVLKEMQASYDENVTDEFIKPIINTGAAGQPLAVIEEGDVVLCFNFRTDRGREITEVLTQKDFPEHGMKKLLLYYVTMTNYDDTFKDVKVLFDKDNLTNTIGEVLAAHGKKQIRIAETEKYPHVTFFFSGGREEPFDGEKRLLCPSPKVATYDLKPEMSAEDIRDAIIPELKKQETDFVCLNFANPDMVGHTGVFEAAVKAVETVDRCAEAVVTVALENGYSTFIIADHGNSDMMINEDGSPNTAHTTNPVPCILVDNDYRGPIKDGKLGDLAPTILKMIGIPKPAEMTGEELI